MFDANVLDVLIHFHSSRATITRTRLMRKMSKITSPRYSGQDDGCSRVQCVYARESIFIASIYIFIYCECVGASAQRPTQ